ncbi:MAG: hypothetical protein ABI882_02910 [Acidobacteriota bacterium]
MKATTMLIAAAALSCLSLCAPSVESAMPVNFAPAGIATQDKKVLTEFRGVRLGFKKEQVQAALGKPSNADEARAEFTFDGENQITIHYDNGEVRAIQISYVTATKVPSWTEVVGDAEISQMESGAKTARKVVNAEHFWVSMYQSKDGSITRITISR